MLVGSTERALSVGAHPVNAPCTHTHHLVSTEHSIALNTSATVVEKVILILVKMVRRTLLNTVVIGLLHLEEGARTQLSTAKIPEDF